MSLSNPSTSNSSNVMFSIVLRLRNRDSNGPPTAPAQKKQKKKNKKKSFSTTLYTMFSRNVKQEADQTYADYMAGFRLVDGSYVPSKADILQRTPAIHGRRRLPLCFTDSSQHIAELQACSQINSFANPQLQATPPPAPRDPVRTRSSPGVHTQYFGVPCPNCHRIHTGKCYIQAGPKWILDDEEE